MSGVTCINKKIKSLLSICLIVVIAFSMTGCDDGASPYEDDITYDIYESSKGYNLISGSANSDNNLFAKDLGVTTGADKGVENVDAACSEGGILVISMQLDFLSYSNLPRNLIPPRPVL